MMSQTGASAGRATPGRRGQPLTRGGGHTVPRPSPSIAGRHATGVCVRSAARRRESYPFTISAITSPDSGTVMAVGACVEVCMI